MGVPVGMVKFHQFVEPLFRIWCLSFQSEYLVGGGDSCCGRGLGPLKIFWSARRMTVGRYICVITELWFPTGWVLNVVSGRVTWS